MSPTAAHPVLILGAGVSGLTFAQGLLKASIPFRLFEHDPTLNTRSQGYRFRIRSSGVAALREVLTPAMCAEIKQTCAYLAPIVVLHLDALTGEGTEGPKGAPAMDGEPPPLNVDRTVMREVLSRGLEGRIQLGAVLRIASSKPNLPQWNGEGRITLIGDAAHAMSPIAGAGATTAVRDAARLAQMIEIHGLSAESLAKYETGVRAYTEAPIQRNLFGGKVLFGMQASEDLKPVVFARA